MAAVAAAALGSASCVAIFGIDELRYATGEGGGGGAGPGGGHGGATGGGGVVGGGDCSSPDCATCRQSNCALQACADVSAACLASDACQLLAQCIGDCDATDGDCVADCLKAYPAEVSRYYAVADCTACGPHTCGVHCQAECQGCSMQNGALLACQSCLNDACAQGRCSQRVTACGSGTACDTYIQCIAGCQDQVCAANCGAQTPDGEAAYMDMLLCLYCTPAACRASCMAEQSIDCGALAGGQAAGEICDNGIDDDGDGNTDCDDPDCAGITPCS